MRNFMLRYKKGIAAVVAICVLATMIPIIANNPDRLPILTADANEKKIAADISTSTGVEVEKVLSLRKGGKSWNEILEHLKGKGGTTADRNEMDKLLTEDVLGEDDVKLLLAAGFTKEEIQQATLIAERVHFQLQEITNSSNGTQIIADVEKVTEVGGIADENNEAVATYKDLEENYSLKTIITLMLKLKDSFGSMEQVMDEYLYSLQVDINLEDYIVDSKAYLEKRNDKSLETYNKRIITMSDIENEMLNSIQQKDTSNVVNDATNLMIAPTDNTNQTMDNEPSSPLPEMKDVAPRNPGEDILEEIQQINPLK